jgi:hypothetical protein
VAGAGQWPGGGRLVGPLFRRRSSPAANVRVPCGSRAERLTVTGTLGKGLLSEIAKRPPLWPTAVRQWRALTPTKWWCHWPPAPRPTPNYLKFRLETMYGSTNSALSVEELVGYLEWCRWMRTRAR